MTTSLGYSVRPMAPADREPILALLTSALAGGPTGRRTDEFFAWKHERNPFGPSLALVAEADGDIVGLRTFMRWRFTTGDGVVPAVRAVDTATHPAHQGKGIFKTLTLRGLEELGGSADLVFNTPNANSLPGYLKMGWRKVAEVPIAIRPVRPLQVVRGLRGARRHAGAGPPREASWCTLPSVAAVLDDAAEVDALLHAGAPADGRLRTDRSAAYLRWRYVDAPGLDYRAIAVREGGALAGLAIGRPRWRGPLAELTLSELLVRRGDTATARRLLREVARSGCDHVAAHLASEPTLARSGWRAGYLSAPGLGMTLVANPLREGIGVDPLDAGSWAWALGDLEVF